MEKSTEQQIQEIIKKNLPEEVGVMLKERLKEAEADKEALTKERTKTLNLDIQLKSFQKELGEHHKLDHRELKVEERENAVYDREKKQDVEMLQLKLDESEKRADAITGYTTLLVRNTIFRKSMWDNISNPPQLDQYGVWQQTPSSPTSGEETKTEE